MTTARKPRTVRTVLDETKQPGDPDSLHVETVERPRAPTKAEIQWTLLRRLENAGAARSKVTITRNAKHEFQFSVEVAGEDVQACHDKAVELEKSLTNIYPPPPSTLTELK